MRQSSRDAKGAPNEPSTSVTSRDSVVLLFLVGCGGSVSTPVAEAPAATSTPEPPTATPTPEPLTATPTVDATIGQVKGILIDGATQQPVKGKQILLATAVESGGEVSMELNIYTSPKVQSDNSGVFLFENLPPGRYILVLDPFFALMDEGKFVITEVEAGQVVDLGTILVQGNVPQLP